MGTESDPKKNRDREEKEGQDILLVKAWGREEKYKYANLTGNKTTLVLKTGEKGEEKLFRHTEALKD